MISQSLLTTEGVGRAPKTYAMVGKKFHRLLVKRVAGTLLEKSRWFVEVVCDCGVEFLTDAACVRSGRTKSCGCYKNDALYLNCFKHGHSRAKIRDKTYMCWRNMRHRCLYVKHTEFDHYGGRGIKICDRWGGEDGFENFLADMGEMKPGMSIERINVNGNYEPSNCKWIPIKEQVRNRRYTWRVSVFGVEMMSAEACRRLGTSPSLVAHHLRKKGIPKDKVVDLRVVLPHLFWL